jgi:hypothetical protein
MKLNDKLVTLRDFMIFKYEVYCDYKKLVNYADLPYSFLENKNWWRWYCDLYGFYYDRICCSYTIWVMSELKRKIGLYMSFFMKKPSKRSKINDPLIRRNYLYKNSFALVNNKNNRINLLNLNSINLLQLTESAFYLLYSNNYQQPNLSSFGIYGLDVDMFISSYNAVWHNLNNKGNSSFYKKNKGMPIDFLIGVNSFFMSSSFFLNYYDTEIIIYPQFYLEYINNKYKKNLNFFFYNYKLYYNKNFFFKIIITFYILYLKIFKYNINYFINKFNKIINKIYNLNIYYLNLIINFKLIINIYTLILFLFYYSLKNYFIFNYIKNNIFYNYYYIGNTNIKKKNNLNYYLSKIIFKKNYQGFNKKFYYSKNYIFSNITKNLLLIDNIINYKNIKFEKKKKQTKYFINLVKKVWLTNNIIKNKYKKILNYFLYYIKNNLNKYKKIFNFKINININKYNKFINNLKISWLTNYGKVFGKVISKFKYISNKSIITYKLGNLFFKLGNYNKKFINKINLFINKFIYSFITILKYNYGFYFNLFYFNQYKIFNNYNIFNIIFILLNYLKLYDLKFKKQYLFINKKYINYIKLFNFIKYKKLNIKIILNKYIIKNKCLLKNFY